MGEFIIAETIIITFLAISVIILTYIHILNIIHWLRQQKSKIIGGNEHET